MKARHDVPKALHEEPRTRREELTAHREEPKAHREELTAHRENMKPLRWNRLRLSPFFDPQRSKPRGPESILTTTNINPIRPLAILNVAGISTPSLIQRGQGIVTAMTGNPLFPHPIPALSEVSAGITALVDAETSAQARTRGAAALRNEKRLALIAQLQTLLTYVQNVADANPSLAASIIEGAGFGLRKKTPRERQVFSARPGPVSGTVKVFAAVAGKRVSYEWQYTANGGATWIVLPPTTQARTTLSGLTPQSTIELKFRAVTPTGVEDWSQPIPFLVQ
jgi:hypothetical protein